MGTGWDSVLKDLVAGKARIGIEADSPWHVVEALDGRHVRTGIVEDLRAIKSDRELGRHRYACDMFMPGMEEVPRLSRPGAPPIQVYGAAVGRMNGKTGSDLPSTNLLATRLQAAAA